jgi:GMP synthase (glutamine-hydrolysing)
MSRTARVFRHLAFEDLGAFAGVLAAAGYQTRYAEMGVDAPVDDSDLLIVLGGPIGACQEDLYPWFAPEIEIIAARLKTQRPILGICLGAQLMARALGARIYPAPAREIGFAPLKISGAQNPLGELDGVPVLHWHGDTFDLPQGAAHLAATAVCRNQAFSCGAYAIGFQFHPEAQEAGFERWLIGHAGEIAATPGIDAPMLRAQMRKYGAAAAARGTAIFARWLKQNSL